MSGKAMSGKARIPTHQQDGGATPSAWATVGLGPVWQGGARHGVAVRGSLRGRFLNEVIQWTRLRFDSMGCRRF